MATGGTKARCDDDPRDWVRSSKHTWMSRIWECDAGDTRASSSACRLQSGWDQIKLGGPVDEAAGLGIAAKC